MPAPSEKSIVKLITPWIVLLTAMGLADYANILDSFVKSIPVWLNGVALFVTAAASLATITPWSWDNKAVRWTKEMLNSVGFNFGKAKNKETDNVDS